MEESQLLAGARSARGPNSARRRALRAGSGLAVFLVAGFALTLDACSDDDDECSVAEQNAWVLRTMREWYLEPDQLPELNPGAYETPQAYLRALTENVDLAPSPGVEGFDRFSRVTDLQVEQNNLANIFSGFGLLMQVEGQGDDRVLRILDVYGTFPGEAASPASEAGLARGDAIETFDGNPVNEAFDLDRLVGAKFIFGFDEGRTHELGIRKLDGEQQDLTLVAAELTPTSVPLFRILNAGDEEVGYIFFRDFDFASVEGLRQAMGFLAERGISKVILDQRYNLGGFVFVIDYLADLLLGNDLADGSTVVRSETWNESKGAQLNRSQLFSSPSCPGFLSNPDSRFNQYDCQGPVTGLTGLTQVVFINSGNTASSAEIILNSLLSHVDVAVIGERSVGKPVGSAPFPSFADNEQQAFCGIVLRPITFRNVNADNEGDFFEGFVPDCPTEDDPTAPLGDPGEASVAAALNYIEGRSCVLASRRGPPAPRRPDHMLDADHVWSYANSLARVMDEGRR